MANRFGPENKVVLASNTISHARIKMRAEWTFPATGARLILVKDGLDRPPILPSHVSKTRPTPSDKNALIVSRQDNASVIPAIPDARATELPRPFRYEFALQGKSLRCHVAREMTNSCFWSWNWFF